MPIPLQLHPDRLFPAEPGVRGLARSLYSEVAALPIVSPHGHTDPAWFATDAAWTNPPLLHGFGDRSGKRRADRRDHRSGCRRDR